jgi:hypothetical protein
MIYFVATHRILVECTEAVLFSFESQISRPECAVTPWSYWSPCSVSCGKGVSVRTRMYVDEQLGSRSCNVQLLESAECNSTSPQCLFTEQTALGEC